jgi:hypothetical protein
MTVTELMQKLEEMAVKEDAEYERLALQVGHAVLKGYDCDHQKDWAEQAKYNAAKFRALSGDIERYSREAK